MLPVRIIARKRDGLELSDAQIAQFMNDYASGRIPDYQMAAFAMAVCINGMSVSETAALTQAMLESGIRLNWPADSGIRADKHSTGGVGDKISLPLAPLLAVCGLQVPMLSGRGLGATGGTLDKLESIPGFRTDLSTDEIIRQVVDLGCVITGTTEQLAPADRRLYALRDVTATVPSIPLITASIMSKKLAESPDVLVLDVKFGSGAFMKTIDQARELAGSLVRTGVQMGVRTTALVTAMNQPLGHACGNVLEVSEAMDVLRGAGPPDVRDLTLRLAAEALLAAGITTDLSEGCRRAAKHLEDGSAEERFLAMAAAQNGRPDCLPPPAPAHDVPALRSGIVTAVDTEAIGWAIVAMGGGRRLATDRIDPAVGVNMHVRIGDAVEAGQPLLTQHTRHPEQFVDVLRRSIMISDDDAAPEPLIADRICGDDL